MVPRGRRRCLRGDFYRAALDLPPDLYIVCTHNVQYLVTSRMCTCPIHPCGAECSKTATTLCKRGFLSTQYTRRGHHHCHRLWSSTLDRGPRTVDRLLLVESENRRERGHRRRAFPTLGLGQAGYCFAWQLPRVVTFRLDGAGKEARQAQRPPVMGSRPPIEAFTGVLPLLHLQCP